MEQSQQLISCSGNSKVTLHPVLILNIMKYFNAVNAISDG